MEPIEPAKVMIVGLHVQEPKLPQIMSTTLEAEGVCLPPQQLKELKAIATERDEQRKRAMGDEEWHGLLDYAQCLFLGFVIPVRLAHLLHHILAEHHAPAPSKTILVKVLAMQARRSLWRLHASNSRT